MNSRLSARRSPCATVVGRAAMRSSSPALRSRTRSPELAALRVRRAVVGRRSAASARRSRRRRSGRARASSGVRRARRCSSRRRAGGPRARSRRPARGACRAAGPRTQTRQVLHHERAAVGTRGRRTRRAAAAARRRRHVAVEVDLAREGVEAPRGVGNTPAGGSILTTSERGAPPSAGPSYSDRDASGDAEEALLVADHAPLDARDAGRRAGARRRRGSPRSSARRRRRCARAWSGRRGRRSACGRGERDSHDGSSARVVGTLSRPGGGRWPSRGVCSGRLAGLLRQTDSGRTLSVTKSIRGRGRCGIIGAWRSRGQPARGGARTGGFDGSRLEKRARAWPAASCSL